MVRVVLLIYILSFFGSICGTDVLEEYKRIFENSVSTPKCKRQMKEFSSNFSVDINSWAIRMLDAGSKIPSGILSLNFGEMGNFQQCLDIKENTKSGEIRGKYCLGTAVPFVYRNLIKMIITQLNFTFPPFIHPWALCIPDGCTAGDANRIADMFFKRFFKNVTVTVTFSDLFCQMEKDTYWVLTPAGVGTITFLLVLTFAVLFATLYDLYSGGSCSELVLAFSIPSNASKIYQMTFNTKENVTSCLNGIRVLSAAWVVLAHEYMFMLISAIVNLSSAITNSNSRSSMFIVNANFAMETFFTIGGTTMAISFLKAQQQKRQHNVFYHVFRRYLRFVPSLLVVTLVSTTVLRHMATGPRWPYLEHLVLRNCEGYYGWMQFSFIQNYLHGQERMCMAHIWYLDVDIQLYAFLHLALFFLWKYQKFFFKFLYVCIVLSLSSTFYVVWKYKLSAIISNIYGNSKAYHEKFLLVTHTHASSWIIGFLLGHFLFQRQLNKKPLKLNKYFVIIAWFLCLGTLYTCVMIGFDSLRGKEYNRWGNVLHITFIRPIWCMAIAWVIVACSSNYGGFINWLLSHPLFNLMNVFSYGVYLVHVIFRTVIANSKKVPQYYSVFNMFGNFLETMCFSTGIAVLLVFLVDAPFAGVLAAFERKKRKEKIN